MARFVPEYRRSDGHRTPFGDWLVKRLPVVSLWANEVHLGVYSRRPLVRLTRYGVYVGPLLLARKTWGMSKVFLRRPFAIGRWAS